MQMLRALIVILASLAHVSMAAEPSFTIDRWALATGIGDSAGLDGNGTETVTNPLHASYPVTRGSSIAQDTYDISWGLDFADFLVQVTHRAANADPLYTQVASNNHIYITANADLV